MKLATGCMAMILASVLSGCGPAQPTPDEISADGHMANALSLMREAKVDEANREIEACRTLIGDRPNVVFQQARITLQRVAGTQDPGQNDAAVAGLLLHATKDPETRIKAQRLLFEVETRRGNLDAADRHRREVVQRYGKLGELEMATFESLMRGEPRVFLTRDELDMTGDAQIDRFMLEVKRLRRGPDYAPTDAVPAINEIFDEHPQLASLRFLFAKYLVFGQIRLAAADTTGGAQLSSKHGLDLARRYLEEAFDQLDPGSELAAQAIQWLARIEVRSTNFETGLALCNFALNSPHPIPPSERRRIVGQKAVSLYKLGQSQEVVDFLTTWFDSDVGGSAPDLSNRWLLHLAYEKLGTPGPDRRHTFAFRPDIAEPDPTHLAFVDVAPKIGVDKLDGYGPNAWGDFDGDGDFDLFVSGGETFAALFRNDGDHFTEVSSSAGLHQLRSCFSSTFADVDNDGWPDLYLGRDGWAGPGPNSLYRNNGDGTFTDVTESAGLGDPADTFVHTWSDIDRDGDLDLYLANGITLSFETNRLYRNNGDWTFTDVTAESGLLEEPGNRTIGAAFADYDRDDWPDLFVSGFQTVNRLYRNLGDGTFEEVAAAAGVDGARHVTTGYVSFFIDLDNDGWPDILRTALAPWDDVLLGLSAGYDALPEVQKRHMSKHGPKLYRNNRDGTFTEIAYTSGLVHSIGNMGANVADVDNDGWIDLYFGTGDPGLSRMEPDRFYQSNGDGTYSERTFGVGLGHIGKGHGITFTDFDGDGDLEIYAAEGGMVFGDLWANAFYLNNQTSGNNWIHIDLEGTTSNRDAVGAKISLEAGDLTLRQERRNGVGFGSSDSPTVEFGLGHARIIDRLHIWWPSGLEQTFEDIGVNQRIHISEGESWTESTHGGVTFTP